MNYRDLLRGIERFGSTAGDVCQLTLGIPVDAVQERVIIAPWWEPPVFEYLGNSIRYISASQYQSVKAWEITGDDFDMTYLKTGIGAPVLTDVVLALGLTSCKKAVFVGSAGAMDPMMDIGDIIIPEYSVSGDGFSRYLKDVPLKANDPYGEKTYPCIEMYHALQDASQKYCAPGIRYHTGKTFSTDSIFAQFAHLDEIIRLGCNSIEMETASSFRAASLSGISLGAILSVSDNMMCNKSLYSGRTSFEMDYRKKVRRSVFPRMIRDVLQ